MLLDYGSNVASNRPNIEETASLLAGAFLLFATTANTTVVITGDPGGVIRAVPAKYEFIGASGDQVIVAGPCFSAAP